MTETNTTTLQSSAADWDKREAHASKIANIILLTGLGPCLTAMSTLTPEVASLMAGAVLGATLATRIPIAAYSLTECAFRGGLAGLLIGGAPYIIANDALYAERLPEATAATFIASTCPPDLAYGREWVVTSENKTAKKSYKLSIGAPAGSNKSPTLYTTVTAVHNSLITGAQTEKIQSVIQAPLPPRFGGQSVCHPAVRRTLNGFVFEPA